MYPVTMRSKMDARMWSLKLAFQVGGYLCAALVLITARAMAGQTPTHRLHANTATTARTNPPQALDFLKQGDDAAHREKWDEAIAAYKHATGAQS